MAAFAIFIMQAEHDAALLAEYRRLARPTIPPYGGKPRVVSATKKRVIEGEGIADLILIEFPSLEQAQAWYDSPEYSALIELRKRACTCQVIFTETL